MQDDCLRYAYESTTEVEQSYVSNTSELGVCMKAFPLVLNKSSSMCIYEDILHAECIGHQARDDIIETQLKIGQENFVWQQMESHELKAPCQSA